MKNLLDYLAASDSLERFLDHFPSVTREQAVAQNIEFQQNLTTLPMAVIVLVANSNRLESLEPLVPEVLRVLETLLPRMLVRLGA